MSRPLRNTQGCWTCRLRKKKCDEGRPHCSTCQSLSITCYGFGPRPDWMDRGESQRAIANSIKQIVKHTSRQKAITTRSSNPVIRIAPKSADNSVHINYSSSQPILDLQGESEPPSNRPAHSHENSDHSRDDAIHPISADESVLLMNFLDNVFPLQYPMYKPSIQEEGRGWLLALLLKTKALYHGALAVSAYHRRVNLLSKSREPFRIDGLIRQEKHLEICLAEFRQSMKSVSRSVHGACPSQGMGTVALIVQLIFFELFAGEGNMWQVHLKAANNMYHRGYGEQLVPFGLDELSRKILREDLPLIEYGARVTEEVTAFRFLSGTMVWLDIISSITSGTAPSLLPYIPSIINSQTKFEEIMGCRNWAMLQIGHISALHELQMQVMQSGEGNDAELEQTISGIRREIQNGLNLGLSEDPNPRALITQIFAYMASIYLYVVTHGFQKLEALDATISGVKKILETHATTSLLPALVAPLYVIGSVARAEDEEFFRALFSTPPLLDPLFEHRGRILPILEEIWKSREATANMVLLVVIEREYGDKGLRSFQLSDPILKQMRLPFLNHYYRITK